MSILKTYPKIPGFNNPDEAIEYAVFLEENVLELEAKLAEAETTIDRFVNGYQGACYACEYVGQKNEVLEERLAAAERDAGRWRRIVNTILKEKAPMGVLSKEWCVSVATDALESDGESLEFKKYGE